jgi:RNA polymerase sigma-70 factor, ECF subfamily
MNRSDERQLLQQAQQGDAEAFAQLYQANVQAIYRYLLYRVHDVAVAEDLTADVFMQALQRLHMYQEQGKPWLAWLYTIAHARMVDRYRRQRPDAADAEAALEQVSIQPNMDENLLRQQAATALRAGMARLTQEQQQVIVLRFLEGCNLEQTALHMGKNANAIKALQFRALRALAVDLRAQGLDVEMILAGLA